MRAAQLNRQAMIPSYPDTWRQFRRWKWCGITALITSLGFTIFGLPLIESRVSWTVFPLIRELSLIACWSLFFYFVLRQLDLECPRCGKRFSWSGWMQYAVAFRRRCVHCSLELYAEGPDKSIQTTREV